ncbi:VanZ family protein, partial [Streptomyces wedmorensis]
MNHNASPSARPGRTGRIVLVGLAVLALAGGLFVVRGPLMMSAPRCMAGRWHGCYDTFNGVVLMTLVALPLALLVVWVLARGPGPGRGGAGGRASPGGGGGVHGRVSIK